MLETIIFFVVSAVGGGAAIAGGRAVGNAINQIGVKHLPAKTEEHIIPQPPENKPDYIKIYTLEKKLGLPSSVDEKEAYRLMNRTPPLVLKPGGTTTLTSRTPGSTLIGQNITVGSNTKLGLATTTAFAGTCVVCQKATLGENYPLCPTCMAHHEKTIQLRLHNDKYQRELSKLRDLEIQLYSNESHTKEALLELQAQWVKLENDLYLERKAPKQVRKL